MRHRTHHHRSVAAAAARTPFSTGAERAGLPIAGAPTNDDVAAAAEPTAAEWSR
ncbi:hypothetical protein RCG67_03605 [Kocuria sp. CPCC 205292]|uniref:hypothetical protein n=1 Tax=Kocuria cellulosilytica TaxID=3071451 RepID=UPI0034D69ADF